MLVDIASVVLDRNTSQQSRRKQAVLVSISFYLYAYLMLFAKFTTTVFSACIQLGGHVT